jgi:chondroitin-sulfate-ABC endolyase/exolyase
MKKSFSVLGVLLPILLSAATVSVYGEETSKLRNSKSSLQEASSDYALIKNLYIRFLIGTDKTFAGIFGEEAKRQFLHRLRTPIKRAMEFDFSTDTDNVFRTFPEDPGYKEDVSVYSPLLQQYLLSLAYGYCVNVQGNPYFRNPEVLKCYIRCLDYLHSRGVREGMTFHSNENRMNMDGAPKPSPGVANLAHMELRMGALCQSILLMEPHFRDTHTFGSARALVRHLEMLGRTSGHVRYYKPYANPATFRYRVQSDAVQNYSDTTLVSALLEEDPQRRHGMLLEAKRVFTDSLKIIPGWADTIKPDFTGFHHRGIYGNAYTGGFIPQAAFGVYVLRDTAYAVSRQSVENLKHLILTYRLYCQKYAMPFGIRGRMPLSTDHIKTSVFTGILIYASSIGLSDETLEPVFARLWDMEEIGLRFLFVGGRGKVFRGLYPLEMLEQLDAAAPQAEPDPDGFWYKPYGGLALHRRDNWMVAVKGYSKYIWDYENGEPDENVYGQYLSHGMLTIFAQGDPVSDLASGYRFDHGWDWYRMPGTTAVHFPIRPGKPLEHRRFSSETFLGGVSCDGKNGAWGMILNQPTFADGSIIKLKARKSVFFLDDLIVLLGSGITGGDDVHSVETTLFQSFINDHDKFRIRPSMHLIDPAGNGYYIPDTSNLKVSRGKQQSYHQNGKTPSKGHYAVAWLDHGIEPRDASYEVAILVRGADTISRLAEDPEDYYRVITRTNALHRVYFPVAHMSILVFFEPIPTDHPIIVRASEPCLVMCRQVAENRIRLGVANPDLGLLDTAKPPPTFRFISQNENQYLPSRPRPVQITLRGNWHTLTPARDVTIISTGKRQSTLRFDCLHGMSVQTELVRD